MNKTRPYLLFPIFISLWVSSPGQELQSAEVDTVKYEKTDVISYLLYVPEEYSEKPNNLFPMLLFLHGAGERGSDLEMVKKPVVECGIIVSVDK